MSNKLESQVFGVQLLPQKTTFSVFAIIASEVSEADSHVTTRYEENSLVFPKRWFKKLDQNRLEKGRVIVIERKNRRYSARLANEKESRHFRSK
jgi:hypothetical protein